MKVFQVRLASRQSSCSLARGQETKDGKPLGDLDLLDLLVRAFGDMGQGAPKGVFERFEWPWIVVEKASTARKQQEKSVASCLEEGREVDDSLL
ncbi:hypothetical protein J0A71_11g24490 [Encephalitozoon cuniculi]|nr:hypothetical protein J0A71_01g02550 [Encephalitozoon cuniculi]UYI26446.1 hypothetical protein J0A71_02g02710 [Encephalitozoon cuniculi]UYI26660.1 hypothetical protein J0A71_02g04910 [Encephalitozoon cuniculi]UYI26674.1 hypothetical protein J0A71_03g05090 [Encephalitozoon cuniculi]UYI26906.1 hypothetical protein J0A71_03g07460 [Encephalitozoon cuniculi]